MDKLIKFLNLIYDNHKIIKFFTLTMIVRDLQQLIKYRKVLKQVNKECCEENKDKLKLF